jgi:hypothetical protein
MAGDESNDWCSGGGLTGLEKDAKQPLLRLKSTSCSHSLLPHCIWPILLLSNRTAARFLARQKQHSSMLIPPERLFRDLFVAHIPRRTTLRRGRTT